MARTFEEWLATELELPAWARGPYGDVFVRALGAALDALGDATKQAVKARIVALAPDDALAFLGADRLLERYPAETPDTYRARIAAAWSAWEFAGTKLGVINALTAAGFPVVAVYDVWNAPSWWAGAGLGAWPPSPRGTAPVGWPGGTWPAAAGDTAAWASRFWVELTDPPQYAPRSWGSAPPFGSSWTWGSSATPDDVAFVRRVVRKWKGSHDYCAEILVRWTSGGGGLVRWPGR